MALNIGGIATPVGAFALSFIVEYIDKATAPLKKTEEQADKTKKSLRDMGDEADRSALKMTSLAHAHSNFSSTLVRTGIIANTTAIALSNLAASLTGMFDGAIKGAAELQTQLISTQLEIGKTDDKTYNSMQKLAGTLAAKYNLNQQDAGQIFYQLGGAFKNYAGIATLAPRVGTLSEVSGGQLNGTRASALMTEYLFKTNPSVAREGGNNPAALAAASDQAMATFIALNRGSRMRYDQIDSFLMGVGPALMQMQNLGVKSTDAAKQLEAIGMMTINRTGQNPVQAGQMAGWAANLYQKQAELGQYGVDTVDRRTGQVRSINDILFGSKNSFQTSWLFKEYMNHDLNMAAPLRMKAQDLLGGEYISQTVSTLLQKGGSKELADNMKALTEAIKNPQKLIAVEREKNMERFDYQQGQFQTNMQLLGSLATRDLIPELAKGLRAVNFYLGNILEFFNQNDAIGKYAAKILALGGGISALAIGLKAVSGLLGVVAGLVSMGERDLVLYVGSWVALGFAITAVVAAVSSNFGGLKTFSDSITKQFITPIKEAKLIFENFVQLIQHPHQLTAEIIGRDKTAGIFGAVQQIAQLQYNVGHFFEGIKEGMSGTLKPFFESGQGLIGAILGNSYGKFDNFLKMLNNRDFQSLGKVLGTDIAKGINMLGDAIRFVTPMITSLFAAFRTGFNFIKGLGPMDLAILGRIVGGPVGTAMQAYGAYKEYKSDDNGVQKLIFSNFLQAGAVKDAYNLAQGGNDLINGGNIGTKAMGAYQAFSPAVKLIKGFMDNASLGNVAMTANEVYINGQKQDSSKDGGGGGPFHGIAETMKTLADVALYGTIAKVAFTHIPILKDIPLLAPFARWAGGHASKLDPFNFIIKSVLKRWGGNAAAGAADAAEGAEAATGAGGAVELGGGVGTGLTGIGAITAGGIGILGVVTAFLGHALEPGNLDGPKIGLAVAKFLDDIFHYASDKAKNWNPNLGNASGAYGQYGTNLTMDRVFGSNFVGHSKFVGHLLAQDRTGILAAAHKFGVDPGLIFADYSKESSLGWGNINADPFRKMGLIFGPGHYGGYGYKGTGANTMAEAFNTNAAIWADTYRTMHAKGLSTKNTADVIRYQESFYSPTSDPSNAHALQNALDAYASSQKELMGKFVDATNNQPIHLYIDGKKVAVAMKPHLDKMHRAKETAKKGTAASQTHALSPQGNR